MTNEENMKKKFILLIFMVTILALTTFPVMSQGTQGSCKEGLVKIAKPSGNDEAPLTFCVNPNLIERFSELGWEAVSPNSSVLAIISAKVTSIADEVKKDAQTAIEILDEATEETRGKIVEEAKEFVAPQE